MRTTEGNSEYRRHSRWVPALIFIGSVLFTLVAWWTVDHLAVEREHALFDTISKEVAKKIYEGVDRQVFLARSVGAYIGSRPDVTDRQFRDFLRREGWEGKSDSIGSVGFTLRGKSDDLAAFKRAAARAGVKTFVPQPLKEFPFVDGALMVDPPNKSRPPGTNMYAEDKRRAAMDTALKTRKPAATARLNLFIDDPSIASVIILVPVYTGNSKQDKDFLGFSFASIRIKKTLDQLLQSSNEQCTVEIRDASSTNSSEVLYSNRKTGNVSRFHPEISENIFGRNWKIQFYSTPMFDESRDAPIEILLAALGLVISCALAYISLGQVWAKENAERYASAAESRAASQELLSNVGSALSSSLQLDDTISAVAELTVLRLADRCLILLGEDVDSLRTVASAISRRAPSTPNAGTFTFETAEKEIREVFQSGQSEFLPHFSSRGTRLHPMSNSLATSGFYSAIFAPIRVRGQVFGVFAIASARQDRHFEEPDLEISIEIALKVALAVQNNQLLQAVSDELAERKRAEEQVRHLNEELEQLVDLRTRDLKNAMEELEAFCYSVSHDLRSPLRSVAGFSQALMEDYGDRLDEEGLSYITRVRKASARMDELITSLLNLSRLTRAAIKPVDIDFTDLTKQITSDLDPERKVAFTVHEGMRIFGDPGMVKVMMDNLIGNAVKFSSKVDHPSVEIGQNDDGSIFVQDNGAGFNHEYANKLFQPFERLHTDREFVGTGIGLATSARIVRRHGGEIRGESELGHGARFTFWLPPAA